LVSGIIETSTITAQIDLYRRADIARNHTATHLLHKALRSVLGEHIQQKGSLVTADYLRFDFTHIQAMDKLQMRAVEALVNEQIRENRSVQTKLMPVSAAREEGAIALFGEKYGDTVRVVNVEGFSKELCGGTHVSATGNISFFKILSESSSAAGIRRIEAITGRAAEQWIIGLEDKLQEIAHKLSCPEAQLLTKLDAMIGNIQSLEKELSDQKMKELLGNMDSILSLAEEHNGIMVLNQILDLPDVNSLRTMGDLIKSQQKNMIAFIFCVLDDKVSILCVVTPDLVNRFHAGKLVGKIAAVLDGKGGGRPDSAMAGGKNVSALPEAQAQVYNVIFA
jgi:alanyl-tRNA synthetase